MQEDNLGGTSIAHVREQARGRRGARLIQAPELRKKRSRTIVPVTELTGEEGCAATEPARASHTATEEVQRRRHRAEDARGMRHEAKGGENSMAVECRELDVELTGGGAVATQEARGHRTHDSGGRRGSIRKR